MADIAAIYRTDLTLPRPPQAARLPLNCPLSLFSGATPISAESGLDPMLPSSGRAASSVAEATGPIPLKLCKMACFSRQMGLPLIRLEISRSTFPKAFFSQLRWVWISFCVHLGALLRRFCSLRIIPTSWRRLVLRACSFWACSSRKGRRGGRRASAKWAMTSASILSVLASLFYT